MSLRLFLTRLLPGTDKAYPSVPLTAEPRYFLCCARCRGVVGEWFTRCLYCGITEPLHAVWVPEEDIERVWSDRHYYDGRIQQARTLANSVPTEGGE